MKIFTPVQLRTSPSWTDWRWQLANAVRNGKQLGNLIPISAERQAEIDSVINHVYEGGSDQMRLTPYLISLINWDNPHDPIALQHIPAAAELADDDFSFAEIWERPDDFYDGDNRMVQQKYPDVILLRLSNTCHSFCRFCFQKERTLHNGVPTKSGEEEFVEALKFISGKKSVRQVLVSGGDPLVMADEILLDRLEKLMAIPHLAAIRINTRSLLHNPFRITEKLAVDIGSLIKKSWGIEGRDRGLEIHFGVHFNHPNELAPEAIGAIRRLQKQGVQVYNQTVLLRGINDDIETLTGLFRKLRQENVALHYLSQAMAVPRTGHFRTSVREGQEIMSALRKSGEFRGQLPHFEVSHYTGKQIVPTVMTETFFEDTVVTDQGLRQIIKFQSGITGQWETFPDGVRKS